MQIVTVQKSKNIKAKILSLFNWLGIVNIIVVSPVKEKKIRVTKWRL